MTGCINSVGADRDDAATRVRFARESGRTAHGPGETALCQWRIHALQQLRLFDLRRHRDLFCLHLHRSAEVPDRTGRDHQIAGLHIVLAAHELPDRSDRVDDRRAGWIRHEA